MCYKYCLSHTLKQALLVQAKYLFAYGFFVYMGVFGREETIRARHKTGKNPVSFLQPFKAPMSSLENFT